MFNNIMIALRKGRMSKNPYMTVFHCLLLMSALCVIGILLTAPCPVLIGYSYSKLPLLSFVPLSVPELLPEFPPLGVVGVVTWLPLLSLLASSAWLSVSGLGQESQEYGSLP